ncbi:hypothetical protein A0256_22230 [Mucilaginibacter sp. PAMC 26640]|nr:hypothetical protein A0256_22230 [Mucilaginibacter sp. PAMC 26640]
MIVKAIVKVNKIIIGLLMLSMFLGACSYKQNQVLFEGSSSKTNNLPGGDAAIDYKIQAQDILQIRNLQSMKYIIDDVVSTGNSVRSSGSEAAGGQGYQVQRNGTVALPMLGRIVVGGLTREEAAAKIEDLYRKSVIKDPIIEVKLINLKVTVFGEVRSPGNYQLVNDRNSLVEILGQAGGLTDKADERQIKIVRGSSINPQTYVVNLRDVSSLASPVSVLQNHDIIYVAQNRRAIRNDKLQNITTIMQPALLLMNTALILYTLSR